jgi:hypothetical protein
VRPALPLVYFWQGGPTGWHYDKGGVNHDRDGTEVRNVQGATGSGGKRCFRSRRTVEHDPMVLIGRIAHGGLKPANVKVLDVGLAKTLEGDASLIDMKNVAPGATLPTRLPLP